MNKELLKKQSEPLENMQNEAWLDKMQRKSKSVRTRVVAKTSLKTFDFFCKAQGTERHSDPNVTYGYIPKMKESFKKMVPN